MEKIRVANIAILGMTICCMIFCFNVANASDPSLLQDFCVSATDHHSAVFVNGKFCKNPNDVKVTDFLFKGFNKPGNTNNLQEASATIVDVNLFPALNTLGVTIARVDFGPYGLNTPHLHHRGSETFAVMEGTLYAGFVTSDNKLFDTVITKGDVIAFPQGLIHFQMNMDNTHAYAIAAFGSQNPGRINVPNSLFGTTPRILDDVLTKGFQVSVMDIERLRAQYNNTSIDTGRSILKLLSERSY
ncbi:putative germin-like protein 2-1 [Chenopodium quinoa]|uniref:Germin-like protein n=1 Tax=Chenopodium quinoa TaxID=63459 RepID=A0A803MSI5_CHEQI|nr:putative germin-like protein 2-1 [Chenopodium quinoa]